MSTIESRLEREEDALGEQLEAGEITPAEYRAALRDLARDYRDAAEEAAREAYDREMERW